MNEFLKRVHKQIIASMPKLALDTGLLTVDMLVGNEIEGALYRFEPEHNAKKNNIVILTISSEAQISKVIGSTIYSLIDIIKEKNDRLIIVHSSGKSKQENEIKTFLSEKIDVFSPNYLRLPCMKSNLKVSIDGKKYFELNNLLKKYYSNEIAFIAPIIGKQSVNIETYKDNCFHCKLEIDVVSGIVFPKTQMSELKHPYWKYYNILIPIYSLPREYSNQLKKAVNTLRRRNTNISPLVFYKDVELDEKGWTVMCPHCKHVINKYELNDNRMMHLFDTESRMNGNLLYYPMWINASQKLINLLNGGCEATPYVCCGGWIDTKDKTNGIENI